MRGLNLFSPDNDDVRPTTGRIKEDMFNIISAYIPDAHFLDLFSGSASVGIEAISRGAEKAYFVDNSNSSISLIKKNITKAKLTDEVNVVRSDAKRFLQSTREKFDVVFIDPPYKYQSVVELIQIILDRNIINEDGILVLEQGLSFNPSDIPLELELFREKKYSSTAMYYYKIACN